MKHLVFWGMEIDLLRVASFVSRQPVGEGQDSSLHAIYVKEFAMSSGLCLDDKNEEGDKKEQDDESIVRFQTLSKGAMQWVKDKFGISLLKGMENEDEYCFYYYMPVGKIVDFSSFPDNESCQPLLPPTDKEIDDHQKLCKKLRTESLLGVYCLKFV